MTRLHLSSIPPKARPKARGRIIGKRAAVNLYTTDAYKAWRAAALGEVRAAWGTRPQLQGPVDVRALVVIQRPKADRRMAGAAREWAPRTPDLDNVIKGVLDARTEAGVWGDDSQVVALTVHRCWGAVAPRAKGSDPREQQVEAEHLEVIVLPADGSPGRW